MKTLESDPVIEFVRDNHEFWATRTSETLAAYIEWFRARDLLATSFCGENLFAVCAVRFFARLEDWLEHQAFDPEGAFAMVELLVSASPLAQADCFEQLFDRWGKRPIVIWERGDRTEKSIGAPRMYRWKDFIKLTRRMTYGNISEESEGS